MPTQVQFLKSLEGEARIGVDRRTMTKDAWDKMKKELEEGSTNTLQAVSENLVDAVSSSGQEGITPLPACPSNPIHALVHISMHEVGIMDVKSLIFEQ